MSVKRISLVGLIVIGLVVSGVSPAIAAKSQTISFPAPKAMKIGEAPQSLTIRASSGLPVKITTRTPAVCRVAGSRVRAVSAGQCIIQARQEGNRVFARARVITRVFMIGLQTASSSQTIAFTQPKDMVVAAPAQPLDARASSNLPVFISSGSPSICEVNGYSVRALSAGVCILTATQPGDAVFLPAPIIQRVFQVAKGANQLGDNSALNGLKCTILGTEGNDYLVGTAGDDVICGFGGDDVIIGDAGNDTLDGGSGNDTLQGGGGNDTLEGNSGTDTVSYESESGVNANLGNDTASGNGNDRLPNVENLVGSGSGDVLVGDSSSNTLSGGGGNDSISGGSGADNLNGGAENDTINGGPGDDQISGGEGNDNLSGEEGNDVVSGDTGIDTCFIEAFEFRDETCQLLPLLSHLMARVSGKFNNWNPAFTSCYLVYADYFFGGTVRALIPIQSDGTYLFDAFPTSDKWVRIMSKSTATSGGTFSPDPQCPIHAGGYSASSLVTTGSIVKGGTNYIEHTIPDMVQITVKVRTDLGSAIPNAELTCAFGGDRGYVLEEISKAPGGSGLGLGMWAYSNSCGQGRIPVRADSSGVFSFLAVKGEKLRITARVTVAGAGLDVTANVNTESSGELDLVFGP
jgi:hypothetical protein